MTSDLPPVRSCLQRGSGIASSLKRAILEVIVSGAAKNVQDVENYATSTLLAASLAHDDVMNSDETSASRTKSVHDCVQFLVDSEFVTRRTETNADGEKIWFTCEKICSLMHCKFY